jgi:uncharacterized membrane protein
LADPTRDPDGKRFGRYIFVGLLTIAPLWVTWLVFQFILNTLSRAGSPGVSAIATMVRPLSPTAHTVLLHPAFSFGLAVVITLGGLYLLGRATTLVIGRRLIATVEALLKRIPLAHPIYAATKRFITVMREQPAGMQRVVFINFPSAEMKTVGLVTKVMKDAATGREVAAVYVPTSPNPTSGYIELVPIERMTETNWTIEEAMRFIMTGGTNAPDTINYGDDSGMVTIGETVVSGQTAPLASAREPARAAPAPAVTPAAAAADPSARPASSRKRKAATAGTAGTAETSRTAGTTANATTATAKDAAEGEDASPPPTPQQRPV